MTISAKLISYILIGVGVALFLGVIWWFATEPGRARQDAADARAGQVTAEGEGRVSRDAAGTVIEGARRDAATDQEIAKDVEELIATPEDRRDAAAVAALCLRDAYKDTPSCVQLRKLRP